MRIAAFIVAALWLIADYFSKQWALDVLSVQSIYVNEFMNFALAFNRGAAFSFLAEHDGWQRWLFTGLAVVVSLWLAYAILTEPRRWLPLLGYGSIMGGAIGNAYDRLVYGHVVDFIQWHYKGWYWPTFNVADVGITIGVILLLAAWLFGKPSREP